MARKLLEYDIFDVAQMNPNTTNGNDSVSKGLVLFGESRFSSVECVYCVTHGAMLAVAVLDDKRMLYRCEVCNNGAIREELEQEEDLSIDIFVNVNKDTSPNSKKFRTVFYPRRRSRFCNNSLDKRAFKRGSFFNKTSMCWALDSSIRIK